MLIEVFFNFKIMKKFFVGLVFGALIAGGSYYCFNKYYMVDSVDEESVSVVAPVKEDPLVSLKKAEIDRWNMNCGDLVGFSASEWFPDFYSAAKNAGIYLYLVKDSCLVRDANALVFTYWDDMANPGYGSDAGVYKYDISGKVLEKAKVSTGENGFNLPEKFSSNSSVVLDFSAEPLAFGCEPDSMDESDASSDKPCCAPGASNYKYDVPTNEITFVSRDPSPTVGCVEK